MLVGSVLMSEEVNDVKFLKLNLLESIQTDHLLSFIGTGMA